MLKNMQETLEYGYGILNEVFFNNELPPVVITIMSSPKTYGHFTTGKVWRADENRYNEINISAEHLDRDIENTMATLMHEMVHFYCQLEGIKDTSNMGRYHNRNFKREAEARGLVISYSEHIGYSVTEPSERFREVVRSRGIEKPLEINRDSLTGIMGVLGKNGGGDGKTGTDKKGGQTGRKKTSTRKYQCPCCKNSFRATKDIRVLCLDCNEEYVKV